MDPASDPTPVRPGLTAEARARSDAHAPQAANEKSRVLLVDDHRIVREGLRALLDRAPDLEVVGEAADGRDALAQVAALSPDVVVMDVAMPDMNGLEATRRICAAFPDVKVIGLSTHSDKRYVHHLLEAGASGYVAKVSSSDQVLAAVRAAVAGETYLSPEVAGGTGETSRSAFVTLGSREREVLQLIAEGRTSAETAAEMQISVKTVETHRRNIVQKLGLHGTAELTKYAVREGLTSLER